MEMNKQQYSRAAVPLSGLKPRLLGVAIVGALAGFACAPAQAFEFHYGDVNGNLDPTLSYGVSERVADRDNALIGKAHFNPTTFLLPNAGQRAARGRFSVNGDDG